MQKPMKAVRVRELFLYSEKIEPADVKNLLTQSLKARVPFLGFLDFSDIFSLNFFKFVIEKKGNTVRFFVEDKPRLSSISSLIFPYSLSEQKIIERANGRLSPKFFFLGRNLNFLTFMIKEDISELSVSTSKIFGTLVSIGSAVDSKGVKYPLIISDPHSFLSLNMQDHPSTYIEILEPIPKKLSLTSAYPVFEETGTAIGVDNFDALQHSLFIGATGSGKSMTMYIMLRAVEERYRDDARIVILDLHGEFARLFPNRTIINFIDNAIDPFDIDNKKTPLGTQMITQMIASSLDEQNKYSERVLFYAVTLLSSLDKLSFKNLNELLTNPAARANFVEMAKNNEVKRFFETEFEDIYIHHFNNAILPILNLISEYELHLGTERKKEKLGDLVANNRITIISIDPHFFGQRMIRFLAGAVLNQMYMLSITNNFKKPTILVIDELPRVENRILRELLAETKKYNLYTYLSVQYAGQLSKEILDSVIANTRNIIAFKLSKDDARLVSSMFDIKIEEYFKKYRNQMELEESKKELFVKLHQREAIVRLFDGKKYLLPMKVKVVDADKWKEPGVDLSMQAIQKHYEQLTPPAEPFEKPKEEQAKIAIELPKNPEEKEEPSAFEILKEEKKPLQMKIIEERQAEETRAALLLPQADSADSNAEVKEEVLKEEPNLEEEPNLDEEKEQKISELVEKLKKKYLIERERQSKKTDTKKEKQEERGKEEKTKKGKEGKTERGKQGKPKKKQRPAKTTTTKRTITKRTKKRR